MCHGGILCGGPGVFLPLRITALGAHGEGAERALTPLSLLGGGFLSLVLQPRDGRLKGAFPASQEQEGSGGNCVSKHASAPG